MNHNGATDKCDAIDLRDTWDYWYKVSGNAGNALASKNAPAVNTCGALVRVYLKNDHPNISDGVVTKRVCVATPANTCLNEREIQVVNCGAFYLYKLIEIRDSCDPKTWRYCTNGAGVFHTFTDKVSVRTHV